MLVKIMLVKIMKNQRLAQQTGFTLAELTIAMSVAAVFIALAAPPFTHFIQQARLTIATNELISAMNLARMEAIKRNSRVDLIANNNNWKNGWIIKTDDQTIYNHEPLHHDIYVESKLTSKSKIYIAYNGTGRTRTDTSNYTAQSGNILLSIGEYSRLIVINFLGRIRVCNPVTESDKTCSTATSD